MFNYLVFDIDNTIYDYDKGHEEAIKGVFDEMSAITTSNLPTLISSDDIKFIFSNEKKRFQNLVGLTAASHNKFIQFKKLLEAFNLGVGVLEHLYSLYLEKFKQNLMLYEGIEDFLVFCKENGIKLYILTNNLCREQIQRLDGLSIYFEKIYTSEEFGAEKPNIMLFRYVLGDIGCDPSEIARLRWSGIIITTTYWVQSGVGYIHSGLKIFFL